jgi:hypothetical protein
MSSSNSLKVVQAIRAEREEIDKSGYDEQMDTIAGSLLEQFPKELADYVYAVAENSRQHPEHFIFPILSAFSYVGSRKYYLQTPEYTTRPNLYFMTVGRKGSGKTNGHKIGLAPIRYIEKQLYDQYEHELAEWNRNEQKGPKPTRKSAILNSSTSIEQIEQVLIESNSVLFDLDEFHGMLNKIQDKNTGDRYSSFFNRNYSDPTVVANYKTSKGGYSDRATNVQMCSTQPLFFSKLLSGEIYHSGLTDRYLFMPLLRDKKPAQRNKGTIIPHEAYNKRIQSLWNIGNLQEVELSLEDEAYFELIDRTNELSAMQKMEPKDSIVHGYYDKLEIALSKLSVIFHLMHCAYDGIRAGEEKISVQNVHRAFKTCVTMVNTFRLCLKEFQGDSEGLKRTKGQTLKDLISHYSHITEYELAKLLRTSKQNVNQLIKRAGG